MSVEDLGKKLLAEVEEVGLDEILSEIRLLQDAHTSHFGFPQLDVLVECMLEMQGAASTRSASPPVVELMSKHTCSGKTQLLYHLTALAVLPADLGGRQAAVLYFDLDRHFSIARLAQQIRRLIRAQSPGPTKQSLQGDNIEQVVAECLHHVQIYKPHSLSRTVSTLHNLHTFLFDAANHESFDRAIAFIALDSLSAFYWQTRFEIDEMALLNSTSNKVPTGPRQQPMSYTDLATALKSASRKFSAPVLYTVRDYNPPPKISHASNYHHYQISNSAFGFGLLNDTYALRPSLLAPFNSLSFATLRLVIRRAALRKLPPDFTVDDALREEIHRRKITDQGKFECFVNEWAMGEKAMEKLRSKGAFFEVFVTDEGVKVGDGPE